MSTWSDILTEALQDLGVLAAGETPSAEDQSYCLTRVNSLLDQWAGERLQIYAITRSTWAIVSGTGSYTVGSGGTVNIARPVYVEHVNVLDTSQDPDLELPLNPLTDDAYAAISIKALTSTYPSDWWYNPTFPLATLELWPLPTSTTLSGVIYHAAAIGQAAVVDTFTLPPGYRRMITTNLAVEIAPGFEREPSQTLMRQAMESKQAVKRTNYRVSDLSIDSGALGTANTRGLKWSAITGP